MHKLGSAAVMALLVGSAVIDVRGASAGGWRDCPCGGYARYVPDAAYAYGPPINYYNNAPIYPPAYYTAPQAYGYYAPPQAYGYYPPPPGYGYYMAYPAQPPVYGGYYGSARWRRW